MTAANLSGSDTIDKLCHQLFKEVILFDVRLCLTLLYILLFFPTIKANNVEKKLSCLFK